MTFKSHQRTLAGTLVLLCALLAATTAAAVPATGGETLEAVLERAYRKFKDVDEGRNADYIPILATVPPALFGLAIMTRDGDLYTAGDVDYEFSIQSVSKPFTAALVMAQQGPRTLREKIGVEPTGLAFNSKLALELYE